MPSSDDKEEDENGERFRPRNMPKQQQSPAGTSSAATSAATNGRGGKDGPTLGLREQAECIRQEALQQQQEQ